VVDCQVVDGVVYVVQQEASSASRASQLLGGAVDEWEFSEYLHIKARQAGLSTHD